jgi:branched-chain amino acid transport system substrate-binding protein
MRLRTMIPTAVAVLALSACGSSDDSSDGAKARADNAAALQGPPIVVGSIASCSGTESTSIGGVCQTLQAWEKWTNAHGGINGHPVKMVVLDDGAVPARAQAAARRLVEQEKVQAIVGEYSLLDATWADYVQDKGVPVVGGATSESPFLSNPDFYPSGAQIGILLYGLLNETKKAGKTKLGVLYCAEAPVCEGLPPILETIADKVTPEVSIAYKSKIAASQPSFTAVCLAAKQKGVEALYIAQNSATGQRVVDECVRQGLKALALGTIGTLDANADDPNYEGAVSALSHAPVTAENTPAMKDLHDALRTYAPKVIGTRQFNNELTSAWAGGELFAAAAKEASLGPESTPADVKRGLDALAGVTLRGIAPPLTFTGAKKPYIVPCYFAQTVKGGKLVPLYDAEAQCLSEDKVPEVMKALAG